jgi:hypothetical protein
MSKTGAAVQDLRLRQIRACLTVIPRTAISQPPEMPASRNSPPSGGGEDVNTRCGHQHLLYRGGIHGGETVVDRGTTEYENSLAPRGASRHCNRMCAYYQRLLILFTCRIHMAVGDS